MVSEHSYVNLTQFRRKSGRPQTAVTGIERSHCAEVKRMRFKWPRKFQGIHPDDHKTTSDCPIKELRGFKRVSIPLDMQIGPGCRPLIQKGDLVTIGQKIGEPLGPWSVPVHASISGKVISVKKEILSDGTPIENVTIEEDGVDTVCEDVHPPVVTDRESFVNAVREAGMVGLGGAAFPTHVKLTPPPGKAIDTLIINAAECEPYITSDDRICIEYPDEVIMGIMLICHYLDIPLAIIGIEDNKSESSKKLKQAINEAKSHAFYPRDGIVTKVLPTRYPTGAEKVLIRLLNGRIVPEGGLPADVGVIVQNVTTVRYIAYHMKTGMPLIRKVVTIAGGAVAHPGNFDVPVGSSIAEVIEKAGGTKDKPAKIIMGGPMMGVAIDHENRPILKHNNAIIALTEAEAALPHESPCISCGRCVRACPMYLMPTDLDKAARAMDVDELRSRHVLNCIECGCCTYVCPAKRYLVQNIRNGKTLVRRANKKKGANG